MASVLLKAPTIKLLSGYGIPKVGLGTWQITELQDVNNALTAALDIGYRHIDTAHEYDNEDAIGITLKTWFDKGGKREDLFITSKLPPDGNRASDVESYLNDSLKKLGLQYLDLYLIHAPFAVVRDKKCLKPAIDKNGKVTPDEIDLTAVWKPTNPYGDSYLWSIVSV